MFAAGDDIKNDKSPDHVKSEPSRDFLCALLPPLLLHPEIFHFCHVSKAPRLQGNNFERVTIWETRWKGFCFSTCAIKRINPWENSGVRGDRGAKPWAVFPSGDSNSCWEARCELQQLPCIQGFGQWGNSSSFTQNALLPMNWRNSSFSSSVT